jgi:hypothetical protein
MGCREAELAGRERSNAERRINEEIGKKWKPSFSRKL